MKKDTPVENEFSDIKIIDLDKLDDNTNINYDKLAEEESMVFHAETPQNREPKQKKGFFDYILKINWHLVLLAVLVISVIAIVHRFSNWGNRIDLNDLDFSDDGSHDIETYDDILPLIYHGDITAADDGVTNVLLLGNDTFAQNRGTSDDMANRIAELSGATVYNCAVSGSYLTATNHTFDPDVDPMDAYNFYWLTNLIATDNFVPCEIALEECPDQLPSEAQEVFDILSTIDFETIDVIGIMYDANDYLAGKPIINHEKEDDIQTYLGNLEAGLYLLQGSYPHIRIIIMSPTYAYAIDEEGDYVDSEIHSYYYDNEGMHLSHYSQLVGNIAASRGISFVDNLYGTVNSLNADNYLLDHVNLNVEGREKLAERFVYALEYYDSLKEE
ncbi:MAG: hypothetical protein IJ379_03340 [Lachnospiraceae bacterium]|nr:hypothetical protein [Lachnospiraceae bacterium]